MRFIPTCVGNTAIIPIHQYNIAVHPHVRGEYALFAARSAAVDGSSPRAWGIHHLAEGLLRNGRFIPTCVGNT